MGDGTNTTPFHRIFIMTVTTIGSVTFVIFLVSLSSILIVRRATTSEASALRKRSFSQISSTSSISVTKWEQQQKHNSSSISSRKLVTSMDHNYNQQEQQQSTVIKHYHYHNHNHNYYPQGSMKEQLQLVKQHVSTQMQIQQQQMQQSSSLSSLGYGNIIGSTRYEPYSPFPRWDVTTATSSTTGVIDSLLDFVQKESALFVQYLPGQEKEGTLFFIHTSDIGDPIQYHLDLENLLRNDNMTTRKTMGTTSDAVGGGIVQHQSEQPLDDDELDMDMKQFLSRPPNWWFPETLYVVQTDGIYGSQRAKNIADSTTFAKVTKFNPTEMIMNFAHSTLVSIVQYNQNLGNQSRKNHPNYWPRLTELLFPTNDDSSQEKKGNSFPFLAHYGDYLGCNYRNWNEHRSSLPVFTVAATATPQSCSHSIPFPNYRVISKAKIRSSEYDTTYHLNRTYHEYYGIPYQFADKISKLVWRGSLTGVHVTPDGTIDSTRYQLLRLIHDDTNANTSTNNSNATIPFISPEDRSLFDIQVTSIPHTVHRFSELKDPDRLRSIGWDVQDTQRKQRYKMEMPTFQKYKMILDVDGHSWSSRFFELLCYESIVLKVQPDYVDYFYSPSANRHIKQQQEQQSFEHEQYENIQEDPFLTAPVPLQPWVHYVPVKKDFSDLVEKTKYVLEEKNQQQMIQIIQNANEWCSTRIVRQAIAYDVLDVWEDYINILDGNNPPTSYDINDMKNNEDDDYNTKGQHANDWSTRWEHAKSTILAPDHPFDMQLV